MPERAGARTFAVVVLENDHRVRRGRIVCQAVAEEGLKQPDGWYRGPATDLQTFALGRW
jgi:hypothetical protein